MQKLLSPIIINRAWAVYYTIGVVGLALPFTHELFRKLIGFSILMSLVVMLLFHRGSWMRLLIAASLVAVGGFMFELIGVNTGLIFGHYAYGTVLGPGFMNTPFLIGLNWFLLIYLVWLAMQQLSANRVTRWFIGAALMVGYDVFLEPIAIALHMWNWSNQAVPVQNYLAWYGLSFVFLAIFDLFKVRFRNPVALPLLASQTAFFVALNIIHQITGL